MAQESCYVPYLNPLVRSRQVVLAQFPSVSVLEGRLVMGIAMLFTGAMLAMATPIQARAVTEVSGGTHGYEAKTFTVVESSIRMEILWAVFVTVGYIGLATTTLSLYGLIEPQIRVTMAMKPTPPQANACPTCGQDLTLVKHYRRWYCWKCRKYRQPLVVCEEYQDQLGE